MRNYKELFLFRKFVLSVLVFVISSLSVFAAGSSILGLDVQKNMQNEYQIFIKSDKNPSIKTSVDKDGSLSILVNKTLPSDSMEIIYDNMPDIQNVIVQKKNNNTLILLQGQNISNAQIFVKDLSTGMVRTVNDQTFNIFNNKKDICILGGILLILLMAFSYKPSQQSKMENIKAKSVKTRRNINANTLRNKNLVQSAYVPSINYSVNGSFNSAYMTKPYDLANDTEYIEEEEIRKAG